MADEATLTSANSPESWVQAYYGDDAFDYKKVEKLRHIKHTGQFASFCYVISKNTKQAHTDFFEDNYTTVDKKYAQSAELILKLLYVKFNEERPLTRADFDACGGSDLFGGRSNYDQIVNDYIGAGGMVEMCQTLIPISTDNAKTAKNIKEINDDIDNVKKDHTRLLSITDSKDGVLNRNQIFSLFHASSDCCSKAWKMHKKNKTKGELELQKDMEDAYMYRYDLAKKSGKMAILAGTTVASIGAIVGGVFWPALLLLPVHSLSKKWIPDWFKSMGSMWGNFEKRFKSKRAIDRAAAFQQYIVSYAETGGKPKLPWKYRRLVRPADIALLKKQAKQVKEGLTLEGTDGKVHKSAMDEALDAISGSKSFGTLLNNQNGDGLVPADAADVLGKRLGAVPSLIGGSDAETTLMREKALKREAGAKPIPTFAEFANLAMTYKNWKGNLSTDAQLSFERSYSEKLLKSAELLVFATPLEDLNDFKDKIAKQLADDSVIMEPVKNTHPDVLETVKRYVTFASKELTGLEGSWKNKTLYEYIHRDLESVLEHADLVGNYKYVDKTTKLEVEKSLDMADINVVSAIECIKRLRIDPNDSRNVISEDRGIPVASLLPMVVDLEYIQSKISLISDENDRARVNALLKKQMGIVFRNAARDDSKDSYSAVVTGEFTGKNNFSDIFEKLKDPKYEDIGELDSLYLDLTKKTKITPPAMGRYLCGKIGKAAYDVFEKYAYNGKNIAKFRTDLKSITEYLEKLNNCSVLTQEQKLVLSSSVTGYIQEALGEYTRMLSENFMRDSKNGGYDHIAIGNMLNANYTGGGFGQLFRTDKSAEVEQVRSNLVSLSALKSVKTNLGFNGKEMSETDQTIIGKVLIRDADQGFNVGKIRKGDDKLVSFLSSKLKCGAYSGYDGIDFDPLDSVKAGAIARFIQDSNSPYAKLGDLLEQIKRGDAGVDFFDKYAAIVALKNKTIVEFRKTLTQMAQSKQGSMEINAWLASTDGKNYMNATLASWSPLFGDIDNTIQQFFMDKCNSYGADTAGLEKFKIAFNSIGNTSYMVDEVARFADGFKIGLSTENSLGA